MFILLFLTVLSIFVRVVIHDGRIHQVAKAVGDKGEHHITDPHYDHGAFRPWRLMALAFKAIRRLYPDYEIWRDFPYEYEFDKLAIDVINGGPALREWVDNRQASPGELEQTVAKDEAAWRSDVENILLYP